MKQFVVFAVILLIAPCVQAQNDTVYKPADFAIVDLSTIYSRTTYKCTVKYNNGKSFGLENALGMTPKEGVDISQDDLDTGEFKILDYFYNKGYETLSVCPIHDFRSGQNSVRFYFKRRNL